VIFDITGNKQAEKELIEAKNKAEESDRLKSAFLANMSHEIRTPMNGILGFTELLREPMLTGEEQQKFIDIIEKSGLRMLNIINDIINISKIEAGQVEISIKETNVNEQLEYIYIFFKKEAEQKKLNLSFKDSLSKDDAVIKTDREKIYAVLTNLVKNAIKFTPSGSIEFGCEKKGEFLEFYVKDTGRGIREEQRELIFERFRQGSELINRDYEGSGLGLTISRGYIEMLGGKIWVCPNMHKNPKTGILEEKGSIFYFTIPIHLPEETKMISDLAPAEGMAINESRKLKILVAEDDEVSQIFLNRIIKNIAEKLLNASNGAEAVEACQINSDLDLILMDMKMPVMDGFEATRKIREFNKSVIIIAQTAYGLAGDREKALEAGCNDYISKPIDQIKLKELINKYFD
jgi:CheY-like chemotaxis protein